MSQVPAHQSPDDAEVKLQRAFSVGDFCRRYDIGRTKTYAEIAAGRLRAVKVGRRTLITRDAAEAWLAALPQVKTRDCRE
jgi:excisionase family DNA binding protein